jgi:hypothetical protein
VFHNGYTWACRIGRSNVYGRKRSSIYGGPRVKFPGCSGFSLSLLETELPWAASAQRQRFLNMGMCSTFSCTVVKQATSSSGFPF